MMDDDDKFLRDQLDDIAREMGFTDGYDADAMRKSMLVIQPLCCMCLAAGRRVSPVTVDAIAMCPDLDKETIPIAMVALCQGHHDILLSGIRAALVMVEAAERFDTLHGRPDA